MADEALSRHFDKFFSNDPDESVWDWEVFDPFFVNHSLTREDIMGDCTD